MHELLPKNLSIKTYWADLTKPDKPVNKNTRLATLYACRLLLERLNKPITETAIDELVEFKRTHPDDTTLERQLKLWKAEASSSMVLNHVARIMGIFTRNFVPLRIHIHVSSNHRTIPISEPILLSIRKDKSLTPTEQDTIDLMAYGTERRNALYMLPLENVHLIENSNVAVLDIPARLSKTGTDHPSIIPKELAEKLLERATKLGYNCILPNYASIWRRITKLAFQKYKVRLTSHYFRKRLETISEKIPADEMNPNHWIILMGSKPTLGHIPTIYSLMENHELIAEYETYLMPRLALTGETIKPQTNALEQVKRENAELKEQLLKLTKLLTEKLTTQMGS